jgi:hypothetical protein
MMAGALGAVTPLAATRDRKVGIGELLGALGGGLTRGAMAGEQAQREDLQGQLGNLVSATKLDEYRRGEAERLRRAQGVAQLAAQLRAEGKTQEAQMLEANPALLDKFAEQKFKTPEPFTVGKDEVRYDGNGRVIARGPEGASDAVTQLSPQEVQQHGLPLGTVAQRDANGKISIVNKPEDRTFAQAKDLRTEFTAQSKPFIEVRDAYGRLETAYTSGRDAKTEELRGPADIGMVFGYMKMLDPGSVVREGEYATVTNSGGVPETIRNMYNKLVGGGVLTEDIRQSLIREAQALYTNAEKSHLQLADTYRGLANRAGVRAEDVVADLRRPMADRNRDKGGAPDPSNPKAGDRVKNSQTGAMIEWNGSAWVPVQ